MRALKGRTHHRTEQHCPANFTWSWMAWDDISAHGHAGGSNDNAHRGEIFLGEFFASSTVPYFCCRKDGDPHKEIPLPVEHDFILLPTNGSGVCQRVKGMTVRKEIIYLDTDDDDSGVHGAPTEPDSPPPEYSFAQPKNNWGRGMRFSICYYSKVGKAVLRPQKEEVNPRVAPVCWPKDNFVLHQLAGGCPTDDSWTEGYVTHRLGPNSEPLSILNAQKTE